MAKAKKAPKKKAAPVAKKAKAPVAKKTMAKSAPKPVLKKGDLFWTELTTQDQNGALSFYQKLFGWKNRGMSMGPAGMYNILIQNGRDFGGVMKAPDASMPSSWLSYFWTDNLDASTRQAAQLGGKVLMPVTEIPGVGHFSVIADPAGAVFALFH